ncbi:hypothetical protein K4H28_01005 [Deefgea tanakiae]|uniref:Uncharacterized protein n=1 Tax=Deefgea tanakiae TaxID=2865840 RepID=A0ABX8ZAA5_9NEIS|nr:hypothetical protein [Deefgea tanakiae]QZA78053.1 hypothetical protein K4H28_01005 [Deefgea tanakiae]
MSTFQFYKRTIESQSEIRNLCVEEEDDFLTRREKLLAQGFEVVGWLIYAPNEEVAIARFNDEMKNPLTESIITPGHDFTDYIYKKLKSIGGKKKL